MENLDERKQQKARLYASKLDIFDNDKFTWENRKNLEKPDEQNRMHHRFQCASSLKEECLRVERDLCCNSMSQSF